MPIPDLDSLYKEISNNLDGIFTFERSDFVIHITEHGCGCT